MKLHRILACATLSCLAAPAYAQDAPPNYGAFLGSYVFPDSVRNDDDGYGAMLLYGAPISERLAVEVNGFGHHFDHESGSGSDAGYGIGLDLAIGKTQGKFGLFGLIGVGGIYEDLGSDEEVSPFADIGGGMVVGLTQSLALRADARYYAILNDTTYSGESYVGDVRVNLGLQFSFDGGEPTVPAEPPAPEPAVIAAAPAVEDSDGDGVPDGRDACPDTPAGFKVDDQGCVLQQTVVFHNIQFELDSDQLLPESQALLRTIGDGLKGQPNMKVEIDGHTCSLGSDAYNLALSKRRAASVENFLIQDGIDADRMLPEGYGETQPIAPNDTEEGRVLNRRVEFKVLP